MKRIVSEGCGKVYDGSVVELGRVDVETNVWNLGGKVMVVRKIKIKFTFCLSFNQN